MNSTWIAFLKSGDKVRRGPQGKIRTLIRTNDSGACIRSISSTEVVYTWIPWRKFWTRYEPVTPPAPPSGASASTL